ncbi:MAG: hypothetical protein HY770_06305 [Chitinivibrionia bacterium]|nr:hypothetical protein [Chitinivibrionia bacterium]
MITVHVGELPAILEGINEISEARLPIKTAHKVAKIAKKVVEERQIAETSRMKLVDRYAEKDENGRPVTEGNVYKFADVEGFGKEYGELCEIEISIDIEPLTLDELGDVQLMPVTLIKLDAFIAEDGK